MSSIKNDLISEFIKCLDDEQNAAIDAAKKQINNPCKLPTDIVDISESESLYIKIHNATYHSRFEESDINTSYSAADLAACMYGNLSDPIILIDDNGHVYTISDIGSTKGLKFFKLKMQTFR